MLLSQRTRIFNVGERIYKLKIKEAKKKSCTSPECKL